MPARPTRRICLFAGHDSKGVVHDYVVHLIEGLSRFSDVHYFSDNDLADPDREKLAGIATICGSHRHGRYDFGSWAKMIERLGWETIGEFDELILANDSCYGPFTDLAAICDDMTARSCDFWGMTGSREIAFHIQSYFIVFKRRVIADPDFRQFWTTIRQESRYEDIVEKYEIGLSRLLVGKGFVPSTHLRSKLNENLMIFPLTTVRDRGMPFVKVKCFRDPYIGSRERISLLFRFLRENHAPVARLIGRHQEAGFLSRAIIDQNREPPVYFNLGFARMRSIRGSRLKIILFDKWRIIIRLPLAWMKKLSRWRCLHVRL